MGARLLFQFIQSCDRAFLHFSSPTWGSRFELKRFQGATSRKSRKSPKQSSPKRQKKDEKSVKFKV